MIDRRTSQFRHRPARLVEMIQFTLTAEGRNYVNPAFVRVGHIEVASYSALHEAYRSHESYIKGANRATRRRPFLVKVLVPASRFELLTPRV
jgi:hypothetical protein